MSELWVFLVVIVLCVGYLIYSYKKSKNNNRPKGTHIKGVVNNVKIIEKTIVTMAKQKNIIHSIKCDYCHNCAKFQWSCPYNSEGLPLVGCDAYLEINYLVDKSKLAKYRGHQSNRVKCPYCGSDEVIYAGYGGDNPRYQCNNRQCEYYGKIFN